MNYYDILEVSQKASPEVIQNAYKTLAKKYHPDIVQGDKAEAEEQMKRINEAYEILSDPQKRTEYDSKMKNEQSYTTSSERKDNDSSVESKPTNDEPTTTKSKRKKPIFIFRWGFITLLMFLSIMFEAKWMFWISIVLGCGRFIVNKKEPDYKTRGIIRIISIGILHFPEKHIYVYASTDEILYKALVDSPLFTTIKKGHYEVVPIEEGTIMKITNDGKVFSESFHFREYSRPGWWEYGYFMDPMEPISIDQEYLDALRMMATYRGIESEQIDYLLECGYTLEEIEDAIYEV